MSGQSHEMNKIGEDLFIIILGYTFYMSAEGFQNLSILLLLYTIKRFRYFNEILHPNFKIFTEALHLIRSLDFLQYPILLSSVVDPDP
jgi:hypothetical protein